MSGKTRSKRLLAVLFVGAGLLALGLRAPADAAPCGVVSCPPGGGSNGGDGGTDPSSGTTTANYTSPVGSPEPVTCSVYANGGGMGSYCVSLGGGDVQTLREKYGNQRLQRCRYQELPPGVPAPFNANPGAGRYMMMLCLDNIDFDTYSGGPDKTLDISVVWVPNGTDTSDLRNGISEFLWKQFKSGTQLPVPFLRTQPNITPIVGVPTFFTFRWIDPADQTVVAEGPYAGKPGGGPYRQIRSRGLIMRAQATRIKVDPNQKGIPSTTCAPDTPYTVGAAPSRQPADACRITFPRSSASARRYATEPIPGNIQDAFYASVTVEWRVTYGQEGDMRRLGDGFTMRLRQVVPVQEVQAPNQPPSVVY